MGRVSEHLKDLPKGGGSLQKSGGHIHKDCEGGGCGSMGKQLPQDANAVQPKTIQGEQRGPVKL